MNVWIINPYGNLPGENWRSHRSWLVSKAFAGSGHQVTYWISNIDHRSKEVRKIESNLIDSVKIEIIESTLYNRHISLKRILFERNFIRGFRLIADEIVVKPDLIIIGEPSLFLSFNFVNFVRNYDIKFVIDVVDLWPELFVVALPDFLKSFHKIIFYPFYLKRRWFLRQCNGLIASCKMYLNLAKVINPNVASHLSYLGVDISKFKVSTSNECIESNFNLIYAGTLGKNYDIELILEVAKKINFTDPNIHFYIAGDGDMQLFLKESIVNDRLTNVTYLGMINPDELLYYYHKCQIALCTYSKDSTVAMPIKAFDYFAAGLPMLNSLGFDLGDFIKEYDLGLNYNAGDAMDLFEKILYLKDNVLIIDKMKDNCISFSRQFDESRIYSDYVKFCVNVYYQIK